MESCMTSITPARATRKGVLSSGYNFLRAEGT